MLFETTATELEKSLTGCNMSGLLIRKLLFFPFYCCCSRWNHSVSNHTVYISYICKLFTLYQYPTCNYGLSCILYLEKNIIIQEKYFNTMRGLRVQNQWECSNPKCKYQIRVKWNQQLQKCHGFSEMYVFSNPFACWFVNSNLEMHVMNWEYFNHNCSYMGYGIMTINL